MRVLGTAWRGPTPCQAWWFLAVPARLGSPPLALLLHPSHPALSEIQLTFCSTSQWMGTGQLHTDSQTQSSHTSLFDLSCRVQCFHYLPKQPPLLLSSAATSSFISGHVSALVTGTFQAVEVIYFTIRRKLFFSSSCSSSWWWLAFICACSACLKHSTFSPLLSLGGLFFLTLSKCWGSFPVAQGRRALNCCAVTRRPANHFDLWGLTNWSQRPRSSL